MHIFMREPRTRACGMRQMLHPYYSGLSSRWALWPALDHASHAILLGLALFVSRRQHRYQDNGTECSYLRFGGAITPGGYPRLTGELEQGGEGLVTRSRGVFVGCDEVSDRVYSSNFRLGHASTRA